MGNCILPMSALFACLIPLGNTAPGGSQRDDCGTPSAVSPSAGNPTDVGRKSVSRNVPDTRVLQEMHDLRAELTRLDLRKRYLRRASKKERSGREAALAQLQKLDERIGEIQERLHNIHNNELRKFELVAKDAALECSEEPLYGQPSYGIILYATATSDINRNELLLFHAGAVYRTKGSFPRLTTTGVGWYFRPNQVVRKSERFVVACIQDAPEEIENVKRGYMPDSDRARDPARPYRTRIFIRGSER